MKNLVLMLAVAALALLVPSSGWTQATTDYSEMDQWVKDSANQGEVPTGTHINMQNWQQYKQYMPLGMVKLFQGQYYWKMPPDVDIEVGPTPSGQPS